MLMLVQNVLADRAVFLILRESQVVEDKTLKQLVDEYNTTHGTSIKVQGKTRLLFPTEMIQAFFNPAISKCLHHVKELLDVSYGDRTNPNCS